MRFLAFRSVCLTVAIHLLMTNLALAHSGRTNAEGCHTNHSTGDYHCHGKKGGLDYSYLAASIIVPAIGLGFSLYDVIATETEFEQHLVE